MADAMTPAKTPASFRDPSGFLFTIGNEVYRQVNKNPSPGIGWQNTERTGLMERGPADTLIALALIHHLAVSNNLPFAKVANFMQQVCEWLIIEFVPKKDSQVQRLLSTRKDIFSDYTQEAFEQEFGRYFAVKDKTQIKESERILYLMQKN